jgi:hypothetical protein
MKRQPCSPRHVLVAMENGYVLHPWSASKDEGEVTITDDDFCATHT